MKDESPTVVRCAWCGRPLTGWRKTCGYCADLDLLLDEQTGEASAILIERWESR